MCLRGNLSISQIKRLGLTFPARYFCLLKILSYASNLTLKSATFLSTTVWSGATPFLLVKKQAKNINRQWVTMREKNSTCYRIFPLQQRRRVSGNEMLQQILPAGTAHLLGSQLGVAVSLGQRTSRLCNNK